MSRRGIPQPGARMPLSALFVLLVLAAATVAIRPAEAQIPPNPIDPNNGEQSLLDVVNSLPVNDIQHALDNFPVPYVVYATANGAAPTVKNNKAGVPTRVDADRSKSTGQGGGGHDLIVEVNTILLPTPGLHLTVTRLGNAPFAQNLQVLIAFPYSAFGSAAANGASPNLFLGY
ncbi:MAG: hypothetical protein KC432_17400, partial [Thermomicrobiales bacterium]|nr:hypothetical protein [Thermomicrobiales bacterium]